MAHEHQHGAVSRTPAYIGVCWRWSVTGDLITVDVPARNPPGSQRRRTGPCRAADAAALRLSAAMADERIATSSRLTPAAILISLKPRSAPENPTFTESERHSPCPSAPPPRQALRPSAITLCTALFARPAQPVYPGRASSQYQLPTMVGEAFTLRYIPREDLNPISVTQDPKHPQRVVVESPGRRSW
jgi:hypothetical protein